MADKNRYWVGVGYPENMIPDWEDRIGLLVQVPYAYCVHTLDKDSKSEHRKDHIHLILVFSNTTTYKHALEVMQTLSLPGRQAFNTCQPIFNIRTMYDYLIHSDQSSIKAGKYLYPKENRILGNNFDIGCYEVISTLEKDNMLDEIESYLFDNNIENFAILRCLVKRDFENKEYGRLIRSNSGYFERLCRGLYLINHPRAKNE